MPAGGARPGAGRPKGSPNKTDREKRVAATGMTPLDYMIEVLRDESNPRDVRLDAAHKAAPYVHPKLASVQHVGQGGGPITMLDLSRVTDADLDRLEEIFGPLAATEDDASDDPGGEEPAARADEPPPV